MLENVHDFREISSYFFQPCFDLVDGIFATRLAPLLIALAGLKVTACTGINGPIFSH
jgi:hypothetical protein